MKNYNVNGTSHGKSIGVDKFVIIKNNPPFKIGDQFVASEYPDGYIMAQYPNPAGGNDLFLDLQIGVDVKRKYGKSTPTQGKPSIELDAIYATSNIQQPNGTFLTKWSDGTITTSNIMNDKNAYMAKISGGSPAVKKYKFIVDYKSGSFQHKIGDIVTSTIDAKGNEIIKEEKNGEVSTFLVKDIVGKLIEPITGTQKEPIKTGTPTEQLMGIGTKVARNMQIIGTIGALSGAGFAYYRKSGVGGWIGYILAGGTLGVIIGSIVGYRKIKSDITETPKSEQSDLLNQKQPTSQTKSAADAWAEFNS